MKTPREILLGRHGNAEHKLNAVRRAALATITIRPERAPAPVRDWLRSFRWHAVGLGAAWMFILLLHVNARNGLEMMAAIPSAKIPPPRVIMTSLRENRRQLSEMIGVEMPAAKSLELFPARPRSERREELLVA
ncbi:MAG TPA: hypothetical protein VH597_12995 [Verrucomicrobiae bacterium]|jgi:hypothetical protein|nr:hypothetical protein [Verrucomicrobiae bacterium]